MSEIRPILYSTAMVQAKQAGRKSQTRRVLKTNTNLLQAAFSFSGVSLLGDPVNGYKTVAAFRWNGDPQNCESHLIECPYGQPGDMLWVRETFLDGGDHSTDPDSDSRWCYRANFSADQQKNFIWKPAIHMPKIACRLFDEIVSVRVERLNEISEADAIAEGIECWDSPAHWGKKEYLDYDCAPSSRESGIGYVNPITSYLSLWESIHGPGSWGVNPYVWVIETKPTTMPTDFLTTK